MQIKFEKTYTYYQIYQDKETQDIILVEIPDSLKNNQYALHQNGIIPRDLKPEELVFKNWILKVN
ncbi:unnamed protein product [Paramecium sonneborni]|uniref:Uncharacterized protein n=1 Tax=Paramecium sonneborni TaxID=65129 RepID=A0A8S1RQF8_9CILI|nr:unnamed protein product [Paramecium sonneborni]